MKDRRGNAYLPLWDRQPDPQETEVDRAIGHLQPIAWMSPARQAEKALGLSGRQLQKFRKRARRKAKRPQ